MRSVIVVPSQEQVLMGNTHSSDVVIGICTLRGAFPFFKVVLWGAPLCLPGCSTSSYGNALCIFVDPVVS